MKGAVNAAALAFAFVVTIVSSNGHQYDLTVLAFGAGIIALAAAWLVAHRHIAQVTVLDAVTLALGAWLVASVLASEVAAISASGALPMTLAFVGYFAARAAARSAAATRGMLLALGVVAVGACFVFVWLHVAHGEFIGGPFVYQHMFAMTVTTGAVVFAGGLRAMQGTAPRPGILLLTLAAAAGFAAMLLTGLAGSRGVLLAVVGAFAALLVLGRRADRGLILALAAGCMLGFGASHTMTGGELGERAAMLAAPVSAGHPRLILWASVIPLISEKPVLGHGPGMLFLVWPPFRDPADWTLGTYAHQSFLDFAVAIGIPGAVLLAMLFVLALSAAWGVRRNSVHAAPVHAAWCAAALVGLLVHSMLDFTLKLHSLWLLFGVCLGFLGRYAPPLAAGVSAPLRRWAALASSAVVVGLSAYAATSLIGYSHQLAAQRAFAAGQPGPAFEHASRAIAWWPSADLPRTQRAHIIAVTVLEAGNAMVNPFARASFETALADARAAMRLNPYRQNAYQTGARVLFSGQTLGFVVDGNVQALALLHAGLARDPRNFALRQHLARELERHGDERAALDVLVAGLRIRYPATDDVAAYHADARELALRLGERQVLELIPTP